MLHIFYFFPSPCNSLYCLRWFDGAAHSELMLRFVYGVTLWFLNICPHLPQSATSKRVSICTLPLYLSRYHHSADHDHPEYRGQKLPPQGVLRDRHGPVRHRLLPVRLCRHDRVRHAQLLFLHYTQTPSQDAENGRPAANVHPLTCICIWFFFIKNTSLCCLDSTLKAYHLNFLLDQSTEKNFRQISRYKTGSSSDCRDARRSRFKAALNLCRSKVTCLCPRAHKSACLSIIIIIIPF